MLLFEKELLEEIDKNKILLNNFASQKARKIELWGKKLFYFFKFKASQINFGFGPLKCLIHHCLNHITAGKLLLHDHHK